MLLIEVDSDVLQVLEVMRRAVLIATDGDFVQAHGHEACRARYVCFGSKAALTSIQCNPLGPEPLGLRFFSAVCLQQLCGVFDVKLGKAALPANCGRQMTFVYPLFEPCLWILYDLNLEGTRVEASVDVDIRNLIVRAAF